jgi:TolB-like protein/Tfp pilus assembly protein PilF
MAQQKPPRLSSWFAELKRRRVFRALVAYGIAAFAVLQIIEPIMHGAHWPEIVLSYVVAALAAGFPIVIALAWVFDVRGARIERTAPAAAATLRGVPLALLLIAVGVLAAAPGLFYYFVVRGGGRSPSTEGSSASNASSIAVLPFASLSKEDENAYFAQGFHDELLRQLGRVGDLRVISRMSVMQYKEGAHNPREIADALGVSSIVEGSVQRVGNRVRVEARLIDARNDRQAWGDRYDRDVTDVFAIQTALAEEIAGALHARLSSVQKAQIERRPTDNSDAYDFYLRALAYQNRAGVHRENLAIAEQLYRQAIQADPSFALARARLAYVKLLTYWFVAGTADSAPEEARSEAEQALHLQPDLPEGHFAMGAYYYWGRRDYSHAVAEFEMARAGLPAEAVSLLGAIMRRQGRFDDAIRYQREALRLDPRALNLFTELGNSLLFTRRYEEADRLLERALTIAPDFSEAIAMKALLHELWKGDSELARRVVSEARAPRDSGQRSGAQDWVFHNLFERNASETVPYLDSLQSESITSFYAVYPKVFFYAVAHEAQSDARAQKEYEAAVQWLESQAAPERRGPDPGGSQQRTVLARAYAGAGRKEEALREAKRAVEGLPMSKDAYVGCYVEMYRAQVEARVGEVDQAIGHIRELLSVPCLLSPGLLRTDPRWAPLRGDPRFRQLAKIERE